MIKIKQLKIQTRLFIKRSPVLYPIAKRIMDKKAPKLLCTRESDLCLEAYTSCANTFTQILFKTLNKNIKIAHHCHSVANLKLALKYKVPAVVIVRNPEDAISSTIARFNSDIFENILEYIDFYTFVKENKDKLIILSFDEITKNTEKSIQKVSKATKLELSYNDIKSLKQEVFKTMKNWNKKHSIIDRVALPLEKREKKKKYIKENIVQCKYFNKANEIFNHLSE